MKKIFCLIFYFCAAIYAGEDERCLSQNDMEQLNNAVDLSGDVRITYVGYEAEKLKFLKIRTRIMNKELEIISRYVLAFEESGCHVKIDDEIEGLDVAIGKVNKDPQVLNFMPYEVSNCGIDNGIETIIKRVEPSNHAHPLERAKITCTSNKNKILMVQDVYFDHLGFVESVREKLAKAIEIGLDGGAVDLQDRFRLGLRLDICQHYLNLLIPHLEKHSS